MTDGSVEVVVSRIIKDVRMLPITDKFTDELAGRKETCRTRLQDGSAVYKAELKAGSSPFHVLCTTFTSSYS